MPPIERVLTESKVSLSGYYGMVENLDWNVGRVLEAVEAEGMVENTYLIYFSAHGDMYEKHEK